MFILSYSGLYWTGEKWDENPDNRAQYKNVEDLPEKIPYMFFTKEEFLILSKNDLSYDAEDTDDFLESTAIVGDLGNFLMAIDKSTQ